MIKGIGSDTVMELKDGACVKASELREDMEVMSIAGREARPRVVEKTEAARTGLSITIHTANGTITIAPDQEIGVLFSGKRVWFRGYYVYPGTELFTYSNGIVGHAAVTSVEKNVEPGQAMVECRVRGDGHMFFAGGFLCR